MHIKYKNELFYLHIKYNNNCKITNPNEMSD